MALNPYCIIICCNSLHKFYDLIKNHFYCDIPVFHAVELVGQHMQKKGITKGLLLATKLTMEDGFFDAILKNYGLTVQIPTLEQRNKMNDILFTQLINNVVTNKAKKYFADIIAEYKDNDVVILGCTEFPLVVTYDNSILPIINPVNLQCEAAVNFALKK
jgi:aspartate racemase